MKQPHSITLVLLVSLLLIFASCNKNNRTAPIRTGDSTAPAGIGDTTSKPPVVPTDSTSVLTGRWAIYEDTLSNYKDYTDAGGEPLPGNFYGGSNDYFNFAANGTLTGAENGATGGGTYKFLPGGRFYLSFREALKNAKILEFSATRFTITGADTTIYGGILTETLYLRK